MTARPISTFWARRIRWGLKAGQTPAWWPVYIFLAPTRRAFYRTFCGSRRDMLIPLEDIMAELGITEEDLAGD